MPTIFHPAVIAALLAFAIPTGNHKMPSQLNKDDSSINGEWFLVPVLPSDVAGGKVPSIRFDVSKGIFSGNTGCNSMRGTFRKTDSSITFSDQIITTKMACIGYNESAFLKNLLRTNRYKIEKGELILLFDATELSRWTRKAVKPKVKSDTV